MRKKPKKYRVQIKDQDGTWDTLAPVFDTVEAAKKAVMTAGEINGIAAKFNGQRPTPFDYRIQEVGGNE